MNYKKTKTCWVDGNLYNLENWVSCGVKKGSIRNDKEGKRIVENLFFIKLPKTDSETNVLYFTYKSTQHYKIHIHLGIPMSTIDEMFLKAEVGDE